MNYKGIDYETQWIEYPDIAPTLKSFGIPPGEDEDTPYTIPAVRFPDGSYVMNSKDIIEEIEKRYPSPDYPSLYLDDPSTKRAFTFVGEFFGKLKGNLLPAVPVKVLTDVSAEYFERTRAGWFGMSLQELAKKTGGEQAWTDSKEVSQRLADALKETEGPFFLGNTGKSC
jgi:glutathione S-transferase